MTEDMWSNCLNLAQQLHEWAAGAVMPILPFKWPSVFMEEEEEEEEYWDFLSNGASLAVQKLLSISSSLPQIIQLMTGLW
jgi:hypothetical protein